MMMNPLRPLILLFSSLAMMGLSTMRLNRFASAEGLVFVVSILGHNSLCGAHEHLFEVVRLFAKMNNWKTLCEQFGKQLMEVLVTAAEIHFERDAADIVHSADFENTRQGLQ